MDAMNKFQDRKGFLPIVSRFAQGPCSTHYSPRNDSTTFKIFVTARREGDMEKAFASCSFPTIKTEARKIDADIEFIQSQLKERSRDVIMDQDVKGEVAQRPISKSN